MGLILVDQPSTSPITSYIDTFNLTEGEFYYYTVWVRATIDGTWRRAADTTGLIVKQYDYGDRLYELIPGVYRDKDYDTTERALYGEGPLKRFLGIFGFQLDHIRTELESLKWVNNPDKVSGGLLPLMAKQWGFGYEQELGMRLARMQIRNASHIYRYKGTRLGIEAVVSTLTGWAPTVSVGTNLMLDQNDSSFVQGLGRWTAALNCTLTTKDLNAAPAFGTAIPPPTGASTGNVGSGTTALQMTATGAGDMRAHVGLVPGDSIPVVAGLQYTFSGYSYARTTARNTQVWIRWYDVAGVQIGATVTSGSVLNSLVAWTRVTLTATAPANAMWAGVSAAVLVPAAGEIHHWDAFQFEQAAAATAWQSARDVRIKLKADRVNWVTNPNMETGITSWVGNNATLTQTSAQFYVGAFSLSIAATAAADASARYDLAVIPAVGTRCIFSMYMRAAVTPRTVRVYMQFLDGVGATIRSTPGASLVDATTGWVRPYVTDVVPVGTVTIRLLAYVVAPAAGEVHYADAALFETSPALSDFFSGDLYSPEGEYVWEGTPGASRTHYYVRRLIKNFRLNQRLPDFLPSGATYTLIYADPSTVT